MAVHWNDEIGPRIPSLEQWTFAHLPDTTTLWQVTPGTHSWYFSPSFKLILMNTINNQGLKQNLKTFTVRKGKRKFVHVHSRCAVTFNEECYAALQQPPRNVTVRRSSPCIVSYRLGVHRAHKKNLSLLQLTRSASPRRPSVPKFHLKNGNNIPTPFIELVNAMDNTKEWITRT